MKNQGITLIALVLTIIGLVTLAGVTVATLTGENGILQKANEAREAMKYAEAEETIKLQLLACQTEYAVNKNINVPEYIAKQNKDIEVEIGNKGTGEPLSYWQMTYKDYIFEINNLQIEGYRKVESKLAPDATIKINKQDYKFASIVGTTIPVEIDVTLPQELQGATISVKQSEETVSEAGTGTVSGSYDETTGKYTGKIETDGTTNTNGNYIYEIKATKDGKEYTINRVVKVDNFLGDLQIEIPKETIQSNELTIKVTNNYPQDANITYKYYISETTDYPVELSFTDKTEVASSSLNSNIKLKEATTYYIKVEAYLPNKTTMIQATTQATTKEKYIPISKIEDLEAINKDLTAKYELMNDLDFKDSNSYANEENYNKYQDKDGDGNSDFSWTPLGSFSGKLNGNDHTIKNLYINNVANPGLFSYVNGATVENLYLKEISIKTNIQTNKGGIAANDSGSSVFRRIYVEGKLETTLYGYMRWYFRGRTN